MTRGKMARRLPVRDVPRASYPGSDHQTMMSAGVETLGIALVDSTEIDGTVGIATGRLKPGQGPRVLQIIHEAMTRWIRCARRT
jgi:hypothetical protein